MFLCNPDFSLDGTDASGQFLVWRFVRSESRGIAAVMQEMVHGGKTWWQKRMG
jgi:hypothetical protein